MTATSNDKRQLCMQACDAEFIRLTANKPVGGVEALRICRESCERRPGAPEGN